MSALRDHYFRMEKLFRKDRLIAEMFALMAKDEDEHILALEKVRGSELHPETIHENAEPYTITLRELMDRFKTQMSLLPDNFDQALEISIDFEKSEVHHIYLALTYQSIRNQTEGDRYFASVLNTHVQRLIDIGKRFDKTSRTLILPVPIEDSNK